jgi:3-hydroxyisobutyrate dehydrogenase-like beta-hydroxyacid dehydrogenase
LVSWWSFPLGAQRSRQAIELAGQHGWTDAELAAQAAHATGAQLTLTGALLPRWQRAAAGGHADDDLAAIYTTP